MITSRNQTNEAFYIDLFEAANDAIKKFKKDYPTKLDSTKYLGELIYQKLVNGALIDVDYEEYSNIWDEVDMISEELGENGINTLEDYFSIIKTLSLGFDTNFQILPAPQDEPRLVVNLNDRTIQGLSSAFTYAVTGDDMAETLFFEVDRYFDNVDLNNTEIAILVNTGKKKFLIPSTVRDITSIESKIIFGWPISREITEEATTLEFAIRFYRINDATNLVDYSLSTQPAKLLIKKSLNYLKEDNEVETLNEVSSRAASLLTNYQKLGTSAVAAPIFYFCSYEEEDGVSQDLNETIIVGGVETSVLTLFAGASTTAENLEYTWNKGTSLTSKFEAIETEEDYYKMINITEEDLKKSKVFYIKNDNDYSIIELPSLGDIDPEIDYYRKGGKAVATEAGYYYCAATASNVLREKVTATKILEIPAPEKLIFKDDLDTTFMLKSKETIDEAKLKDKYGTGYTNVSEKYIGDVTVKFENSDIESISSAGQYNIYLNNAKNNANKESDTLTLTVYNPISLSDSDFSVSVNEIRVTDFGSDIYIDGDSATVKLVFNNIRPELYYSYTLKDAFGNEKATGNIDDQNKNIEIAGLTPNMSYTLLLQVTTDCKDFYNQEISLNSIEKSLMIRKSTSS